MVDKIAYCGIDCSKCVKFKDVSAEKAKEIIKAIEESGLDEWQEHAPRDEEFSYEDFKKGLKWFEKYMRCPGCKAGGGMPDCCLKHLARVHHRRVQDTDANFLGKHIFAGAVQ